MAANTISIRMPDDWHSHLRQGEMMKLVAPYYHGQFGRVIIMPNTNPPITKMFQAEGYREEIREAFGTNGLYYPVPLMTVYLTDSTDPNEIKEGYERRIWVAAKLYPAHATTGSAHGVTRLDRIYKVLEKMEKIGMPVLIHGEQTHHNGDSIDPLLREGYFLRNAMQQIRGRFPALKMVLEHITTTQAVMFILGEHERKHPTAATITPHHLFLRHGDIFEGFIRPDRYCLPIAKFETDRKMLLEAATSGLPCFFLGTDSAPHDAKAKYGACGCAGIFNVRNAIGHYADAFDSVGKLDALEDFASKFGAKFYRLEQNENKIQLVKEEYDLEDRTHPEEGQEPSVANFRSGKRVGWHLANIN